MSESAAYRDVYVLDDDTAVRDTLAKVLQAGGYTAICFMDGPSLLKSIRHQVPLCILLDLHLPGLSGMEVLRALRLRDASIPLIIISGTGDIGTAVEALKLGADDYIEKPFRGIDLVKRLEDVIKRRQKERLALSSKVHLPGHRLLTAREMEILEYCLAGDTSKETAQKLAISPRTVEDHRANIMQKLNVKNITELVRKVMIAEGRPGTHQGAKG